MSTTTATPTTTTALCTSFPLAGATLLDGFCAGELPLTVQQPRSIVAVGATDFLMLERGTASVVVGENLLDGDDGDGIAESLRTLVTVDGLNHGLAVTSTHLYASTPTEVYRWPYDPTTKTILKNNNNDTDTDVSPELIIENMNADGNGGAPFGHTTRTLVVDENTNQLYVSVGSNENIDPDSFRARIRVFSLNETVFPMDFLTGPVFADGLRNEVAMEMRPHDQTLWGAGNSADRLARDDLGGDAIFNDNPAEEVHRFDMNGGQNFGYPYCFREYELGDAYGLGRGTAWAWPTFLDNGTVTDQQCRDNYDSPVLAMQAHSAPLGITFYQYSKDRPSPECDGVIPFPAAMDGDAFITFHGSWNRDIPTGYKVVYVPVTEDGTGVVGGVGADPIDLLTSDSADSSSAKWDDGFRPVDVSFDACGRLLVSSDGTRSDGVYRGSKIVRIERIVPEEPEESTSPTPSPNSGVSGPEEDGGAAPTDSLNNTSTIVPEDPEESANPTPSPNSDVSGSEEDGGAAPADSLNNTSTIVPEDPEESANPTPSPNSNVSGMEEDGGSAPTDSLNNTSTSDGAALPGDLFWILYRLLYGTLAYLFGLFLS